MWVIRWFLTLIFLIYAALFAAFNFSQKVDLVLPWVPLYRLESLPVAVIALIALGLGMAVWAVFALFASLELRARIRQLERHNRDLKEELTRLRNLSVLDDHELEGAGTGSASGELLAADRDQELDEVTAARNSGL
jgi:membrane protein implicated in regulation of membrane protease activity